VKYRDILDNHLWPVLARHFADKPCRFQNDNAPVHWARIIEEFKRDNDIHGMTWPAQSPNLNIIENVWLRIKRSLQNAAGNINTPEELFTAIQDIWMNFTVDYIQNLYTSIPRRILAVILIGTISSGISYQLRDIYSINQECLNNGLILSFKNLFILLFTNIQRRLKSIRENKMADVNEFELLLFAPLKYTR
jgi:hypothetical protein